MKLIAENLCLYDSGFLVEGTFPFHFALFKDSNGSQNVWSDFHRKQALQYREICVRENMKSSQWLWKPSHIIVIL